MRTTSRRADELAEAMIDLVAEGGLDVLSVRAVAARAGVSIGTVQYHFATKDDMLVGAFGRVVARVDERLVGVTEPDPRRQLTAVLAQLVPLDDTREAEARVMVAFAAAAVHHPGLAEIQSRVLSDVVEQLAQGFAAERGVDAPTAQDRTSARLALAAVDGLALHAVSGAAGTRPRRLKQDVDQIVVHLLGPGRP